jgi:hypothetical protein
MTVCWGRSPNQDLAFNLTVNVEKIFARELAQFCKIQF